DRNCNYSIAKYPEQWEKYVQFTHAQIDELMSDYGKMDILWLDGGWVRTKTEAELKSEMFDVYEGSRWARNPQSQDVRMGEIVQKARAKQPGLIVVDRAVPGPYQNYLTPEQHIPETGLPYPWETCMTMAGSWSYVPNDKYKPTDELIEKLVDIVSKGGNFLLNIGPSPSGEFDPVAYERLRDLGAWMKTNGEAIYGTRKYETFQDGERIRFTESKDGKTQFVFFFDFPKGKVLLTKIKPGPKARLSLLGSKEKVSWKPAASGVELSLPESAEASGKHVWVVRVDE
ncbi:MAG: alpha-L-fucosidase, partial [Saprospiraceae bacterium]|nr:alpha-L-fucosidase [Saprospiraceae bacterium]